MRRQTILFFLLLAVLPSMANAQSTITTVAGGGPNGLPALSASLNYPAGVARDSSGNLYVSVQQDCRVYKIDSTGQLTVFAGNAVCGYNGDGGPAASAELVQPSGVAVGASRDVFIAGSGTNGVREGVGPHRKIQTVAGNGVSGYTRGGGRSAPARLAQPPGTVIEA